MIEDKRRYERVKRGKKEYGEKRIKNPKQFVRVKESTALLQYSLYDSDEQPEQIQTRRSYYTR